jgi:hypothetical protein
MLHSLRVVQAFVLALSLQSALALPERDLHWRFPKGPRKTEQQGKRQWTVGQPVRTSSGTVVGHAATNTTQVSEYLGSSSFTVLNSYPEILIRIPGIPYAVPPVGNLRFARPQPFRGIGTITAAAFVNKTNGLL